MATTGHESEVVDIQGLASAMAKAMNLGISNKGTCGTAADMAAKTVQVGDGFTLAADAMVLVTFQNAISTSGATLNVNSTGSKPIYYRGAALTGGLVQAKDSLLMKYDGTVWNIVGSLGQNTDISYDTTNKKLTKSINGSTSDVVTAAKIVTDGGGITNHQSVSDNNPILAWGTKSKVGKVGDTELHVTMPANPASGKQDTITDLKVLGQANLTCTTASNVAAKTIAASGYVLVPGCIVSVLFTYGFTASNPTLNINNTGAKSIYYHGKAVEPFKIKSNTVAVMQYNGTTFNIISYEPVIKGYIIDENLVDLGLPSGNLWAKGNIVKDSQGNYSIGNPTDEGASFSWGNIVGYRDDEIGTGEGKYQFTEANYQLTPGYTAHSNMAGYESFASNDAEHDAAVALIGNGFHLPTRDDIIEMFNTDYTTHDWVEVDGVQGMVITSISNGNSIFFPRTTYNNDNRVLAWSSTKTNATASWNITAGLIGNPLTPYYYVPYGGFNRNKGEKIRPIV